MNSKQRFVVPRNHLVAAVRMRPSGAHVKTVKAIRKSDKQALRKRIKEHHDSGLLGLFHDAPTD